jgi:MerR family transcriptional regulator, light-induced transcriptional regulator
MSTLKRAKRATPYLSPRTLAAALGVSESSLKRWADEGRLTAERTAGGHRRIRVAEAVRFIRRAGLSVVKPELLGVELSEPSTGGERGASAGERLYIALVEDRWSEARSLIVSLYLDGSGPGWIFDGPVREALARVGELWKHDPSGIFLEHRAVDTCLRALQELRQMIPPPPADAPVALGGGFADDVYLLPSTMAAMVLADAGWEAWNLGADTPVEATIAAIRHYRPRMVWQSFSATPRHPREAAAGLERIAAALEQGTLVVGGRGADSLPLPARPTLHRIGSMAELAAFARGVGLSGGGRGPGAPR